MYTRNNLPSHPAILSNFKSVTERDQNISDPHHIELTRIILIYHKSLLQSAPLCQLAAATKTPAFLRMYLCHQSRALYPLPRVKSPVPSKDVRCASIYSTFISNAYSTSTSTSTFSDMPSHLHSTPVHFVSMPILSHLRQARIERQRHA